MKLHSLFAVVLAGGSGTRFWPRSRQNKPKQLCKITDAKQTMLEQTLRRLDGFIPVENRMIVTHAFQEAETRHITSHLCKNILSEPLARNTSAALALAVLQLRLLGYGEDTVMCSLHSDHLVKDVKAFQKTLQAAAQIAREGYLCLVGIVPRSPETGFGYIKKGSALAKTAFKVETFKEKPDLKTAKSYLQTGDYVWNSGMFVWTLRLISEEFKKYLPELWSPLFKKFEELREKKKTFLDLSSEELLTLYKQVPEIAIDNGILEKSEKCAVIAGEFEWNDVGTWTALTEVFPTDAEGNLIQGQVIPCQTNGSILMSDGLTLATYGVQDLIVVVENGCVLVCPKDKAQGIKEIVAKLKEKGLKDLI